MDPRSVIAPLVCPSHTWHRTTSRTPGEQLELPDGTKLTVLAVVPFTSVQDHYNLAVAEFHTYFAGSEPVLVHNCGGQMHHLISRKIDRALGGTRPLPECFPGTTRS